jgi:hypothetical protein
MSWWQEIFLIVVTRDTSCLEDCLIINLKQSAGRLILIHTHEKNEVFFVIINIHETQHSLR